jgi:hypothetical protein
MTMILTLKYLCIRSNIKPSTATMTSELAIEKGRYEGILLENRICFSCDRDGNTVIEDEFHFLLCCPLYTALRELYIDRHFWQPALYQHFISLMSTQNIDVIKNISCFIVKANETRKMYLANIR